MDRDDPLTQCFWENLYENKFLDEGTGQTYYQEPLKEYSKEEIELIYTIDPLGLAGYVQEYAFEEFSKGNDVNSSLKNMLDYKDRIFCQLFGRSPRYYRRKIDSSWEETTNTSDLTKVLSESEFLFGWHVIYDMVTLIEFIAVVVDVVSMILVCPTLKSLGEKIALPMILKYFSLACSVGESVLKADFCGLITAIAAYGIEESTKKEEIVIPANYKTENYNLGWIVDLLGFSSDLDDLAETFNSGPHFYKEIFAKCVDNTKYNVMVRTTDGKLVPFSDINNVIA